MANIGVLNKGEKGVMKGMVRTSRRAFDFQLEPNPAKESQNSPDYRACGVTEAGELFDIGAGWLKKHEGREYISLNFDDPDWPSPLSCAAFPMKNKPGFYDLIWSR